MAFNYHNLKNKDGCCCCLAKKKKRDTVSTTFSQQILCGRLLRVVISGAEK